MSTRRIARQTPLHRAKAVLHRVCQSTKSYHDSGMATAEYAVATLAAVAFAGLLAAVVSSGQVRELLLGLITKALS